MHNKKQKHKLLNNDEHKLLSKHNIHISIKNNNFNLADNNLPMSDLSEIQLK